MTDINTSLDAKDLEDFFQWRKFKKDLPSAVGYWEVLEDFPGKPLLWVPLEKDQALDQLSKFCWQLSEEVKQWEKLENPRIKQLERDLEQANSLAAGWQVEFNNRRNDWLVENRKYKDMQRQAWVLVLALLIASGLALSLFIKLQNL